MSPIQKSSQKEGFMERKDQISTTNKVENFSGILSMLDRFAMDGKWYDLRETYFKKIALPAISALNLKPKPKTLSDARLILKKNLKKTKSNKPNFFID